MEIKYQNNSVREYRPRNKRPPNRRKKQTNLLPIILIIVLLAAVITSIIVFVNVLTPESHGSVASSSESSVASENSSQDTVSSNISSQTSTVSVSSSPYSVGTSNEPWNEWYLKIVSAKYPIDDSFKPELSVIKQEYAAYDSMKFDSRAIGALEDMIAAARNDKITLTVISSYRDVYKQDTLFQDKVNRVMKANASLSRDEAEELAATEVTRPYTSEHHTGLDVDFNLAERSFENTQQATWLKNNAETYGFVLRYPEDKQDITGIIYESWHYRFVGVEHASRMNELDMCLEEYVDYLKAGNR